MHQHPNDMHLALDSPRQDVHLPQELLLYIMDFLSRTSASPAVRQRNLHACSLVSISWSAATIPFLYSVPILRGQNYDLFTRTLCPSINLMVRKSPLSSFVRHLDLSLLVHSGSKSTTARLLGRTKDNLLSFTAPQASFSLNCFPALSKCQHLRKLDLSLISEATTLQTLFHTISRLLHLTELRLPRTAGFGTSLDPSSIAWPPELADLHLAGGLDAPFWHGAFRFPSSLKHVSISYVPHLNAAALGAFLHTLAAEHRARPDWRLDRLSLANLPHLERHPPGALDPVLAFLPALRELSLGVVYVSPAFLAPPRDGPDGAPGTDLVRTTVRARDDDGDDDDEEAAVAENMALMRALRAHGAGLALQVLELTCDGDPNGSEARGMELLDVLMAAQDEHRLPNLRLLRLGGLEGWANAEDGVLGEVEAWLERNGRGSGLGSRAWR